jgi:SAM-dependent methyltransferase
MPFLDASFDLVVSRFAVHHFAEPALQIGEMARVCRPAGRVAIIDMVAADDALAAEHDRLERLRDPSHTRALGLQELTGLLEDAGVRVEQQTFRDRPLPVERWLAQADTPPAAAAAIRAEIQADLDGGPATGTRPELRDGELCLTHRWAIASARRHGGDGGP